MAIPRRERGSQDARISRYPDQRAHSCGQRHQDDGASVPARGSSHPAQESAGRIRTGPPPSRAPQHPDHDQLLLRAGDHAGNADLRRDHHPRALARARWGVANRAMKHRKKQAQPRSLPLSQWPSADRAAWEKACQRGERLRRGGRASHMRPVTQEDLAKRYGLFLDFVQRTQRLEASAAAGAYVIPEYVHAYVGELQQRVSSVTAYGSIYKLRRATEIVSPGHDVSWLTELEKDLDLVKQPQ